jgi:hypothetical protein
LFALVAISVVVIGSLLAMRSTTPAFAQAVDTSTPAVPSGDSASPVPTTSGAQAVSLVELWDKFCVSKVPYTLLALPQDATFSVTQPTGLLPTPIPGYSSADQTACDSAGVFRGKQVIVCRGPQLFSFSLKVSSGGATQDYQVPLKECALPHTNGSVITPAP